MRVAFTGGGSGGHIFPIVAVARKLKELAPSYEISRLDLFYIGPNGFSKDILLHEGIRTHIIPAGKLRRYISFEQVKDLFKFMLGFVGSFIRLWLVMPDVVFGKGGYGSFWVVFLAWFFRIPVVLHDSDSIPGLANRILAPLSSSLGLSFEESKPSVRKKSVFVAGNPTREELFEGTPKNSRELFNIKTPKPVILIMGGSQGAERINQEVLDVLSSLVASYEVIHQCGEKNYGILQGEIRTIVGMQGNASYHLFPFLDLEHMAAAYHISDLIISRAGAGSIFEIARAGKPSILIPLANSAANHQLQNATIYTETGAGVLLEEPNFTPHIFLSQIETLMQDKKLLSEMGKRAKEFSRPDAARVIAEEILRLVVPKEKFETFSQ